MYTMVNILHVYTVKKKQSVKFTVKKTGCRISTVKKNAVETF